MGVIKKVPILRGKGNPCSHPANLIRESSFRTSIGGSCGQPNNGIHAR